MESAQEGRGGIFYSQIHGHHHSEKSSGAKTPRTPSVREPAAPNYNDMYTSGRSSREKTPSARNGSGEKTPNIFEHRLVPSSGRSSTEKTPREIDREQRAPGCAPLNETSQLGERRRSLHKRERSNERRRVYEDEEEDERHMYNERQLIVSHHASGRPTQSSNGEQDYGRVVATPPRRKRLSKSTEFNQQGKHGRNMYDGSEEDSGTSMLRGEWNNSQPGIKTDIFSNSQVSVVQRYVQAQAKALTKYNHDSKENINHDEWDSDLKKSKSTKNLTQQKAIAAVLAFQRWRHTQLKKLFSLELKKVLEEAKEDEACLAQLEKELATKDKHLVQLRAQLAQRERESHEQINQRQMHELLGANVQELEKECQKALERASLAEDVLRKCDTENVRLRERLRSLDEEGVRLDSELQTNLKLLQSEKDSALDEGRVLLAQLTRRDEEVAQQCKEIEKLRTTLAQISDRQTSQQKQVADMKADHHAQVQNLQDKLQQAYSAKHTKEMELASFTERCNGLGEERQSLLVQLHRAVERADLASRRAEELQMKLHYTTEERAKASEDVASEMVEHLKRLTGHMKELETSVDQNGLICLQPGALQKRVGLAKISTNLAQAELDTLNLISQPEGCEEDLRGQLPFPEIEESKRQVYFSSDRRHRRKPERSSSAITPFRKDAGDPCNMLLIDRDIALTKLKKWTAWKWRWAAAAARADNLLKQLQSQQMTQESQFLRQREGTTIVHRDGSPVRGPKMGLVKKIESSQFVDLNILDRNKVGAFILKHKLVPLIMSAWRAFARLSGLERKAISRNESLNKIISALPWWIRRVGERRVMERFFFHWQLLTLKATRVRSSQAYKRKIVPYVSPVFQTKGRGQDGNPPQGQAQAQAQSQQPAQPANSRALIPALMKDVEVQTAGSLSSQTMEMDGHSKAPTHGVVEGERRHKSPIHKGMEMDGRQRTPTSRSTPVRATSTPRSPLRAKSEAKTALQCPTCEIRKKYTKGAQQQQVPTEKAETTNLVANTSTFTARALRALQGSLQQELKELQYLLSQEMEDMLQTPVMAEDHENGGNGVEITRHALKSVFEVCNNLAQALMEVRSQLNAPQNQGGNIRKGFSSPLPQPSTPRVHRPRYQESRDTSQEGGRDKGSSAISRDKPSLGRQPHSVEMRTPHYAAPIGRDKGARFSSPGWRSQEKSTLNSREPWNHLGSPLKPNHLWEREARLNAPSTLRELREFKARQDQQQYAYENNYQKGGRRESSQDKEIEIEETLEREPLRQARRAESVVRFSPDETKAVGRDNYEQQPMPTPESSFKHPPPPDYTTVVQILNQENTKIGEVAIHTCAVAPVAEKTTDRGGIADLCSPARDAICAEVENNKTLRQSETQKPNPNPPQVQQQVHQQQQQQQQQQSPQQPRTPQQLAEEAILRSPQPNCRSRSALKLGARGQSTPKERSRSHHVLRRPTDLNPSLDDTYFLSLRRKQCIGSDYADMLRSEIVRLREGRLMLEDCKTFGQGEEEATPSRDVTPRHSSFLANRPSWRPHYTANTATTKK